MDASKKSSPTSTFSQTHTSTAHDLGGDLLRGIVEQDHVVGVPANGARDVHRDLVKEQKQRRELVGHVFGGVEMPRIDEVVDTGVAGGVGEVELIRADGHGFETNAEHLRFAAIDHAIERLGEDLVERILQALAQSVAIAWHVLQAVGNPDAAYHLIIERFADLLRDATACLAVVDSEAARLRVGRGERQLVVHLGVAEDGGVEVDPVAALARPIDPRFEVRVRDLVAIDPGVFRREDGI